MNSKEEDCCHIDGHLTYQKNTVWSEVGNIIYSVLSYFGALDNSKDSPDKITATSWRIVGSTTVVTLIYYLFY